MSPCILWTVWQFLDWNGPVKPASSQSEATASVRNAGVFCPVSPIPPKTTHTHTSCLYPTSSPPFFLFLFSGLAWFCISLAICMPSVLPPLNAVWLSLPPAPWPNRPQSNNGTGIQLNSFPLVSSSFCPRKLQSIIQFHPFLPPTVLHLLSESHRQQRQQQQPV